MELQTRPSLGTYINTYIYIYIFLNTHWGAKRLNATNTHVLFFQQPDGFVVLLQEQTKKLGGLVVGGRKSFQVTCCSLKCPQSFAS